MFIILLMNKYHYFSWRENLKILLKDINHQKKLLKENGIVIDGKHYHVQFVGKSLFLSFLSIPVCLINKL